MGRILLVGLLLGLLLWLIFGDRLRRLTPQQLWRWALPGALIGLLLLLAVTGHLNWLIALIAALVALVQRLMRLLPLVPLVQRLLGAWQRKGGSVDGQTSGVQTRFLRMTLDHDSGALAGAVVAGRYAGRLLADLDLPDLLDLLEECRPDHESVLVLETYLDRVHGDAWRDARAHRERRASGHMTREEAYRILGLEPGAGPEEVIKAHRRLMQKLHPDRGGSDWLAAQINRAKEFLTAQDRRPS